jgi:nitroreductase
MRLDLSAEELLTTTRAVRKRLDFERPVERGVIEQCVELALQAPTGSNRQGWQFVFVDDADTKNALAELYARHFDIYASMPPPNYDEGDPRAQHHDAVKESATYLRDHFHEAPVLMVPVIEGRLPENNSPVWMQASIWGSLLPAVWSFMLAARLHGLGTAWTTLHLPSEQEAAELLGIPFERFMQGGLIPVAYTKGTDFKPASRLPARQLMHWNEW